jgi:hypothetical protein
MEIENAHHPGSTTYRQESFERDSMKIVRQVPWKIDRESAPIAILCVTAGVACGLLVLPAHATRDETAFSLVMGLVLALACWLAWSAVSWHIDLARRAAGPYLLRHSGLLFALPMWSMQSFQLYRQTDEANGLQAKLFWLLFSLLLPAPFALWGGIAFQYAINVIFGRRDPPSSR